VEDNADVRTYVREHLISYQILESRDGVGGIETAREVIPDLIISDVMMPGKDGYELCRTLKTDEKTSHIPIILLTAKAGSEDKIEGLETGADDYLAKPFEPKELVARVRNLIESRRRLRKRFTVPLKPGEIAVTSMDDAFLKRAIGIVNERLSDENFGVDELGSALNMSRSQLHRKLTALTSQSTGEFIRYMRLHRAKDLLERGAGTVAEIAFSVGFSDPSHFSRRFHRQFGVTPSDLRNGAP
jgi:CheY-like chemotaxis protein